MREVQIRTLKQLEKELISIARELSYIDLHHQCNIPIPEATNLIRSCQEQPTNLKTTTKQPPENADTQKENERECERLTFERQKETK